MFVRAGRVLFRRTRSAAVQFSGHDQSRHSGSANVRMLLRYALNLPSMV